MAFNVKPAFTCNNMRHGQTHWWASARVVSGFCHSFAIDWPEMVKMNLRYLVSKTAANATEVYMQLK